MHTTFDLNLKIGIEHHNVPPFIGKALANCYEEFLPPEKVGEMKEELVRLIIDHILGNQCCGELICSVTSRVRRVTLSLGDQGELIISSDFPVTEKVNQFARKNRAIERKLRAILDELEEL